VGAEVMNPLATPVLGGMVSSLLHVLVVTPVIFFWIRARGLPPEREEASSSTAFPARRRLAFGAVCAVLIIGSLFAWTTWRSQDHATPAHLVEIQTIPSGPLRISLLSDAGVLRQGRNDFTIEFRTAGGQLVDVGQATGGAAMAMPGMVMSGGLTLDPGGAPGRYHAIAEFGMAGAWQLTLEWSGAGGIGAGKVSFEGAVK